MTIMLKKLSVSTLLITLVIVLFQNCGSFSSAPLAHEAEASHSELSLTPDLPSEASSVNGAVHGEWLAPATASRTCPNDFHLESDTCVNNNKICFAEGILGTQGWANAKWSECRTCLRSHTSWQGLCHPNVNAIDSFASLMMAGWNDGVLAIPALAENGFIGIPSQLVVDQNQSVSFKVGYARAKTISLSPKHIQLEGPGAKGCQINIQGNGLAERQIIISSCQGLGPLRISITAGSALSENNVAFGPIGPSSDVIVFNPSAYVQTQFKDDYVGSYSSVQGETLDFAMYYPKEYLKNKNWPVLIWIHGGGWMGGTNKEDEYTAKAFAESGFIVINANYRVAKMDPRSSFADVSKIFPPSQTYSAGSDDIKALVRFVYNNVHLMNGDKNKISIAGSSAGAHLAMHQATRKDDDIRFKCVINAAGPTHLLSLRLNSDYPVTQFIVGSVFGSVENDLKNYSPSENFAGIRAERIVVLHQLRDNLVPIDQALEIASKKKKHLPHLPLTFLIGNAHHEQPLLKPQYEQVTHAFFNESENQKILKAVSYSQCR
ncbi:MAG: alpha/beta hydrolase [Bdellovibrionaceae bacterium]|nr:alpha/beta hydrolase [Pseudobdellovibrionaceae bacterium]